MFAYQRSECTSNVRNVLDTFLSMKCSDKWSIYQFGERSTLVGRTISLFIMHSTKTGFDWDTFI